MQIPLCLFLVVAVPALVTASQQSTNCIGGCKCMEDLSKKKLRILDCDSPLVLSKIALGDISKKITNILFKNVVIRNIDNDTFDGFNDLETVQIEDSHIGAIHPSAFNQPELGTISFVKTTFEEVPTLSSTYLEELIFNDCHLTEVPKLDYLPELSFVNFANNKIRNIDENAFSKCDNLEEVNLNNNSISKLPVNLFVNCLDFTNLNVDHNPLESFELNLSAELELLSLQYCKLSVFDRNSAKNLDTLSSLSLSGNQITVLPFDAFDVMENLNYIDLSNNKLVELDDNIFFNNSQLDRIIFDNNHFTTLPNFQTRAKSFLTTHFSCNNCGLTSIGKAFENMPGLVRLELSNNMIADIEGVFTEMRNLNKLDLSFNDITTIGVNSFGINNRDLQTLNLTHNPLKPLDPVVFANIFSLKELDISDSNLTKLWTNHNAVLPSLEILSLRKNNLTVISDKDLLLTPKLIRLDLLENPLKCTTELHLLIEYLRNKPIYPLEKINLFKTHEAMVVPKDGKVKDELPSWKQLAPPACALDDANVLDKDPENSLDNDYSEEGDYEYDKDIDVDEDDDDDGDDNDDKNSVEGLYVMDASLYNDRSYNLAKASWILSIASVFILSALIVLTVAVAITLLILKRNKSFNMHNGNLPRFKIPLWNTATGQKRHSGSVYKPLSEDLSGPRTPIINRYEFKQTPQVHNSIP